jgi:hypothetical protein
LPENGLRLRRLQCCGPVQQNKRRKLKEQQHILSWSAIAKNTVHKNGSRLYGQEDKDLPGLLLSIYQYLGLDYPKFYKMDQLSKLGWLASEILLQHEAWIGSCPPEEIGLILSNANSSLDTDHKYWETVKAVASPAVFVYTLPNIMMGEISIRNGFKGENGFFIFDRWDAAFLEQYVGYLLDTQLVTVCICGWVELLGDEYQAVLFLVTTGPGDPPGNTAGDLLFTKENLDRIYKEATQ